MLLAPVISRDGYETHFFLIVNLRFSEIYATVLSKYRLTGRIISVAILSNKLYL